MLAVVLAVLRVAAPAVFRAVRRRARPVVASNEEWFEAHQKWEKLLVLTLAPLDNRARRLHW
jgi:hypothetical protein